MKTVYVLQSIPYPRQSYIGMADDLGRRPEAHNAGRSAHTMKHKPWRVIVAVQFADIGRAVEFERYLKSGSGHAFLKRHFWPRTPGAQFYDRPGWRTTLNLEIPLQCWHHAAGP